MRVHIINTPTQKIALNVDAIKFIVVEEDMIIISLGGDYLLKIHYEKKLWLDLLESMGGK